CSVGIHLIWLAGMNKIYNNTLIHNDKGISIWGSGGNSILNNTISKNNIGILVDGWAMDQAGDNSILNNTISNNNIGISLEGDSSGNVVANNRVELNTQYAVYINQIKDNLGEKYVGKESYYGINRFYNNIFNNTVNIFNDTGNYTGDVAKEDYSPGGNSIYLNTSKTSDTNIICGPYIG